MDIIATLFLVSLVLFMLTCFACHESIKAKENYRLLLKEYTLMSKAYFELLNKVYEPKKELPPIDETNTNWEIRQ